jgi:hypothetical protein
MHSYKTMKPTQSAARTLLCVLLLTTALPARLPATSRQPKPADSPLSVPPRSWAVDCAANEALVIQHPNSYLRFRLHEIDEKGDHLRDQIETPDGTVARVIQRDGRPLSPDEDATERQRLNDLLTSPFAFARHNRREQQNKQTGVNLLKLMPDAMLWSYTPGQPQLPNRLASAPALIVLDFKPDPTWSAPTLEADPLTGLEGRIWIDPTTRRLVRLEGDLAHAVNVGWGMLARIYPGGTVTLQQTDVDGQRWIVGHVDEQITVRALMLKNVKQHLVYDTADYQPVPAMTYQQAIKILLDTPLPTH